MDSQRIARIFGLLYLITFLTSIPALILFQPVLEITEFSSERSWSCS